MTTMPQGDGIGLAADHLIALRHVALLPVQDRNLTALPGGYATKRKGTGQEISDVRSYVTGDDLRHLDKGATARTGELHVRQFREERDRVVLLVADFRPEMFWGLTRAFLSVAAAEALTMIGWRAIEDGARVGLLAITPTAPVIVPTRGRIRGMLDVIGGMVTAHQSALQSVKDGARDVPDLSLASERVSRICPAGSEVVFASGFDGENDAFLDTLNDLSQRRTPRLIYVTDAQALQLPTGRYPVKLANGRRADIVVDGAETGSSDDLETMADLPVTRISASDSVDRIARHITDIGSMR